MAQSVTKLDSFMAVIQKTTDTVIFKVWSLDITTYPGYSSYEKAALVDACIVRTEELNLDLHRARFIFRKSILKTIDGEYEEALALLNGVIPIFEKSDDLYLAGTYNTTGNMLSEMGDQDKAVEYLMKSIQLIKKTVLPPQRKLTANINSNLVLGNIYLKHLGLDSAVKYFKVAYDLCQQKNDKKSKELGFALMNMAGVELRRKDFKKSIALNRRALEIGKGKHKDIECYALGKIGTAYREAGQYDSAIYYLNLTELLAKEYNIKRLLLGTMLRTKGLYEKQGLYKKAFKKLEEHNKLKNEIDSTDKSASANFLVSEAKRQEKKEAKYKIGQEKVKQRNLQIGLLSMIGFIILLSLITYFWYQRKKLKEQIEKDRIEKEMIRSQIRAINSQMNPHFVFNALNSIQELIVTNDIRNSNIYLGKFADLMRKTLEYSQEDEIYLNQELDVLKLYLDLEQRRFGEELTIEIINELSDEQLSQTKIPSMLLQPYVENALKHGLLHKAGEKKLTITLENEKVNVLITIKDNGIGRKESAELNKRRRKNHKSYALNANQNRLDLIKYSSGRDITVAFIDLENNSGTKVIFSLSQEIDE